MKEIWFCFLLYKKEPSIVSLFKHKKNECCLKWTNTCLKCIILQILITQCNFRQEKGTFRHSRTISQRNTSWSVKNQSWNAKNRYKLIHEARFKHENWLFRQTLKHSDCEVVKKDWPSSNEKAKRIHYFHHLKKRMIQTDTLK